VDYPIPWDFVKHPLRDSTNRYLEAIQLQVQTTKKMFTFEPQPVDIRWNWMFEVEATDSSGQKARGKIHIIVSPPNPKIQ